MLKGAVLSSLLALLVYFGWEHLVPSWEAEELWPDLSHPPPTAWYDVSSVLGSVSSAFWLYPLIGGGYLLASSWGIGVAEAAFYARHLRPVEKPIAHTSWQEAVVRMALVANYALVCLTVQYVPWVGAPLAFVIMCFVDGYFCFEQVWMARGWTLDKVRG